MTRRPFFNCLLFLASFFIVASLLFGIYGCSPQPKKAEPVKPSAKVQPAPPPAVPANLPFSVDFDNAPLSEVAQFITNQTGKGLILSGNETKPVTWIESKIPRDKLFDSFTATINASGLILKPANESKTLFSIEKPEEPKTAYQLNFATSSRGTFFLLGATVYPLEKFPYPARFDAGHWYAILPKSTADQLNSTKLTDNAPM